MDCTLYMILILLGIADSPKIQLWFLEQSISGRCFPIHQVSTVIWVSMGVLRPFGRLCQSMELSIEVS